MIRATEQASEKYWSLKILNYRQLAYSQAEGDGEALSIFTRAPYINPLFTLHQSF